jgi:hypothetical protein
MENQLIDVLKLKIQELTTENNALKGKMTLMYSNWSYDYNRFILLKEKCKFGYCKQDNNTENDEITIKKPTNPPSEK